MKYIIFIRLATFFIEKKPYVLMKLKTDLTRETSQINIRTLPFSLTKFSCLNRLTFILKTIMNGLIMPFARPVTMQTILSLPSFINYEVFFHPYQKNRFAYWTLVAESEIFIGMLQIFSQRYLHRSRPFKGFDSKSSFALSS